MNHQESSCMNHLESDYDFIVHKHVIAIKDLNLGGKSVTNNIEAIVLNICSTNQISPEDYTIIYSDSEGIIDEFRWRDKSFHPIPVGNFYSSFYKKCLNLLP